MAKPGKKKKSCDKYKLEGHLEKNKDLKKARNEKRIEYFMKRRNEGKHETCGHFVEANQGSKQARHTDYSKTRSIFDKLHREIAKEKMEEKRNRSNDSNNEEEIFF